VQPIAAHRAREEREVCRDEIKRGNPLASPFDPSMGRRVPGEPSRFAVEMLG